MTAHVAASNGELAVVRNKHFSTQCHGETTQYYTFRPIIVTRTDLRGYVTAGRDAWDLSVKIQCATMSVMTLSGSDGADLLPKLEREYDDLASVREAVRAAMSSSLRSEGK